MGATVGAGQQNLSTGVGEQHRALVASLVFVDQSDHRLHAQAHAGGTDEALLIIEHAVVDEYGGFVLVGHVHIDIDLIGLARLAQAEVPGVAPGVGPHLLEHALGLVVGEAAVGDEEAGAGGLTAHHGAQVAGDAPGVLLAGQHPVAQEGVLGHHRGDQHRADQVFLDLGVDGVGGQRQLGVDDAVADRPARGVVAEQRGGQEAAGQQQQQGDEQRALREQGGRRRHDLPVKCAGGHILVR